MVHKLSSHQYLSARLSHNDDVPHLASLYPSPKYGAQEVPARIISGLNPRREQSSK